MYRIYDKDQQRWRKDITILQDGALAVITKGMFNKYRIRVLWDEEPYVIHNETGFYDKHGHKIFEGDICKTSKVENGIVGYGEPVGAYCIFDYDNDVYYIITDEHAEDIAVIGNVFDGIVVDISESEDGNEAS